MGAWSFSSIQQPVESKPDDWSWLVSRIKDFGNHIIQKNDFIITNIARNYFHLIEKTYYIKVFLYFFMVSKIMNSTDQSTSTIWFRLNRLLDWTETSCAHLYWAIFNDFLNKNLIWPPTFTNERLFDIHFWNEKSQLRRTCFTKWKINILKLSSTHFQHQSPTSMKYPLDFES